MFYACVENRDAEAVEKFRGWLFAPDPEEVRRALAAAAAAGAPVVPQAPSWWDEDNSSWLRMAQARQPVSEAPAPAPVDGGDTPTD